MVSEPRLVKEEKHQPCSLLSLLLADQVSCRSYVGRAYRMRSLAVYSHLFMYFRAVGLLDPIRCVLKHGTGHAVKCLGWLCPATFIFLLFETPMVTLWSPCVLKHVMWQRVFLGASGFKLRNLIQ